MQGALPQGERDRVRRQGETSQCKQVGIKWFRRVKRRDCHPSVQWSTHLVKVLMPVLLLQLGRTSHFDGIDSNGAEEVDLMDGIVGLCYHVLKLDDCIGYPMPSGRKSG